LIGKAVPLEPEPQKFQPVFGEVRLLYQDQKVNDEDLLITEED